MDLGCTNLHFQRRDWVLTSFWITRTSLYTWDLGPGQAVLDICLFKEFRNLKNWESSFLLHCRSEVTTEEKALMISFHRLPENYRGRELMGVEPYLCHSSKVTSYTWPGVTFILLVGWKGTYMLEAFLWMCNALSTCLELTLLTTNLEIRRNLLY